MPSRSYTKEELNRLSISDLLAISRKEGVQLGGSHDKASIVDLILEKTGGGGLSFSKDFMNRWMKAGSTGPDFTDKSDSGSLNLKSKKQLELEREMEKIETYMSGKFKEDKSEEKPTSGGFQSFMDGLEHLGVTKERSDDLTTRKDHLSQASLSAKKSFHSKDEVEKDLDEEISKLESFLNVIMPGRKDDTKKRRPAGLTDRGPVRHRPGDRGPGLINGDGIKFMLRSKGGMRGKGLINGSGLTNGLGFTNGRGLVNGTGLINGKGLLAGLGRGFTNGLRGEGGLINGTGLTNGTGFTNGEGILRYYYLRKIKDAGPASQIRKLARISLIKNRARKEAVVATFIILMLLVIPVFVYFLGIQEGNYIRIDGKFSDWKGIQSYPDLLSDVSNPSVDLVEYSMTDKGADLSFFVQVKEDIFSGEYVRDGSQSTRAGDIPLRTYGEDTLRIYMDTDSDAQTGYMFQDIGADALIEVSGYNGSVTSAYLKHFKSSTRSDHNGFVTDFPITARIDADRLEAQIWANSVSIPNKDLIKVRFAFSDSNANLDVSDSCCGLKKGTLEIRERIMAPEFIRADGLGTPTAFLSLGLSSEGASTKVFSLGFEVNGNVSESSVLALDLFEDKNSNSILDASDVRLASAHPSDGKFNLTAPLEVKAGLDRDLLMAVSFGPNANNTHFGIRTRPTGTNADLLFTLSSEVAPGVNLVSTYLGAIPDEISIDGAFADWNNVPAHYDSTDTVGPAEGQGLPNIDLNEFRVKTDNVTVSVNLQVRGDMLGGTTVPVNPLYTTVSQWQGLDKDKDGVPDPIDPQPETAKHSDTDGIYDDYETVMLGTNASRSDTDGDGIRDNEDFDPLDPLVWQYIPLPGAPVTQASGQDRIYIFFDTARPDRCGYRPSWLPFCAEYVLIIEGKYGQIYGATLMRYRGFLTSTEYNFTRSSEVPVAIDGHRMETYVLLSDIEALKKVNVFIVAYNWNNGTKDTFDSAFDQDGNFYESAQHSLEILNPSTVVDFNARNITYTPDELAAYLESTDYDPEQFEEMKKDAFHWSVVFKASGTGKIYLGGDSFPGDLIFEGLWFYNEATRQYEEVPCEYESGIMTANWAYRFGKAVFLPINDSAKVSMAFGDVESAYLGDYPRGEEARMSIGTRAGMDPQKEFYLRRTGSTYFMNTAMGTSQIILNINRGASRTWQLDRPFASAFNISNMVTVSLYLRPYGFVFWYPSVNVSLRYGTANTLVGFKQLDSIQGTGWYDFAFTSKVAGIPKGQTMNLTVSCIGQGQNSVDVYFNSQGSNSRIEIHTPTYVDVNNISAYNGTKITNIITPGRSLDIRAKLTDPIGSYDIMGANLTIKDVNGNVMITSSAMSLYSTDSANPSYYKVFNKVVSFSASLFKPGIYFAEVVGRESNGVTDIASLPLTVPAPRGVSIFANQTRIGITNSNVTFQFTVSNLAQRTDVIEFNVSASSQGWSSTLYNGPNKMAADTDGNGIWNWVNSSYDSDSNSIPDLSLSSLAQRDVFLTKYIPAISNPAKDSTVLKVRVKGSDGTGYLSSSVNATLDARSPGVIKALYLHDVAYLNTTMGASQRTRQISAGNLYSWTMNPAFAGNVSVLDFLPVDLYLQPTAFIGWKYPVVKVTLSYGSTTLGSETQTITSTKWYRFVISPVNQLPKGAKLKVDVAVTMAGTSVTVYFNSSTYNSRVSVPTNSLLKIDSIWLQDDAGNRRSDFSAGMNMTVFANVSDPFGTKEIRNANVSIYSKTRAETLFLGPYAMGASKTDTAVPPYWTLYSKKLAINNSYPSGDYTVKVSIADMAAFAVAAAVPMKIQPGVDITPNNTASGTPGTNKTYAHQIKNTGKGNDLYDITVKSSQGFNVSVYEDRNKNGVLDAGDVKMGTDTGGDGTWNYVNSAYDSNGNTKPDTGKMNQNVIFYIIVEVQIPPGTPTCTDVTNVSVSSTSGAKDYAIDSTGIPEFEYLLIPVSAIIIIFIVLRKKKAVRHGVRTKSEN